MPSVCVGSLKQLYYKLMLTIKKFLRYPQTEFYRVKFGNIVKNKHMEKKMIRYVKGEYYHGKNAIARVLDRILAFLGAFLAAGIFMWASGVGLIASGAFALLFCVTCEAVMHAVRKSRMQKLAQEIFKKKGMDIAMERLVLSEGAYEKICNICADGGEYKRVRGGIIFKEDLYFIDLMHPLSSFDAQCAARAVRLKNAARAERLTVITTAKYSGEARDILIKNGGGFGEDVIKRAVGGFYPTEDEICKSLAEKYDEQRMSIERLKKGFTEKSKAKGWALSALMLTAWGLIFGKSALYYGAAGICAALCAYCIFSDRLGNLAQTHK